MYKQHYMRDLGEYGIEKTFFDKIDNFFLWYCKVNKLQIFT